MPTKLLPMFSKVQMLMVLSLLTGIEKPISLNSKAMKAG